MSCPLRFFLSAARQRNGRRLCSTLRANIAETDRNGQHVTIEPSQNQPKLRDFLDASMRSQDLRPFIVSNRLPHGDPNLVPYIDDSDLIVNQVPVFIKTYGCQMNVNDTEIASSVLKSYGYVIVDDEREAEIYLLMTCAIRDSAESKIWKKLHYLRTLKSDINHPLKQIGLLGCMAERLKEKVLDTSNLVDIVAGPDAYRDLPKLFAINNLTNRKAVNCLLSIDETYSDIPSCNINNKISSFVSITRGCDNLCTYCIVPFTRGRERSRPLNTILDDIKQLHESGVKEVTLLGQNVNSYRDMSSQNISKMDKDDCSSTASGFRTIYKPKKGGLTFDVLLEEVAKISPELRVRFTSPHPKDFTDSVIDVIRRFPNIAKCIHLPAQSGNNSVLETMQRGYTREAYLDLVERMRLALGKDLALTSDFIAGFCGETEEAHRDTLKLIEQVRYNYVYVFQYSMREKTRAFHRLVDDVEHHTKIRRLEEIRDLSRSHSDEINKKLIGTEQLILIECESRRSVDHWRGRADNNVKVIIPKRNVPIGKGTDKINIKPGDYVVSQVLDANSQTLKGEAKYITSMLEYYSV